MKSILENDETEYYWKIRNAPKNEIVEKITYEKFSNIINAHRKKCVIVNTLSLLIINVFINGENELFFHDQKKRYVFSYWNSYENMKMTGLLLNFSKSHTKNDFYWYGDLKVYHRTLEKILDEMEKENWCVRRDGYFCLNNGYNKQFEIGYYLFNWPKLYEIYIQYDELNIEIDDYSPVVIKKRKEDGQYRNVTNEYNTELLFKDDVEYINNLRNMYSKMNVTLDIYNANDIQKDILYDYVNQKRYNFEMKDESNVFHFDVESEIKLWNKRLSKPYNPYRLYHDDGKFCWGRVYGNGIDSVPKMYKDSILKINGNYTVSIDVKSSILQFYILTYHEEIDNKQDMYRYITIQDILDRENIKIMSQCLNYNKDLLNAFRAYNNHYIMKQDYNSVMKLEQFQSIYNKMIQERNYLKYLFLHPEMSKSIILHEADFMKTVSQMMIHHNIPHLCNFDAIYTSYKNISTTIELFYSLSIDKFNKPIFIDYDKDLYNSLINNNRC